MLSTTVHYLRSAPQRDWTVLALAGGACACFAASLLLLSRPWSLESLGQPLATVLFFYAGIFLSAWAQKPAGTLGMSTWRVVIAAASFQGSALILVSLFLRHHRCTWNEAFGFRVNTARVLVLGTLAAAIFLPIGWGLQVSAAQLMALFPQLHLKPEVQQSVLALQVARTWLDRVALGTVTILLAPLAEEVLFRGILYPWIRQLGFPRLAFWGTTLLFAGIHLNVVTFVPLLALAVLLTVLYDRTRNLLAPIVAHSLFNAMNFLTLFLIERFEV